MHNLGKDRTNVPGLLFNRTLKPISSYSVTKGLGSSKLKIFCQIRSSQFAVLDCALKNIFENMQVLTVVCSTKKVLKIYF